MNYTSDDDWCSDTESNVSHQEIREFADFCDYCAEGSITDVRMALEKNPSLVDIENEYCMTALEIAIKHANYNVFKLLIKYDAYDSELNVIAYIGAMPNAKEENYVKIFKYIHNTFKVSTKMHLKCLENTLLNNYEKLYRVYVDEYKVNFDNIYNIYRNSKAIVGNVIRFGSLDIASIMSVKKSWYTQKLKNHIVAAMYSSPDQSYFGLDNICENLERYSPGVIHVLASVGADVDHSLLYTARTSNFRAVKALLEGGANPNTRNSLNTVLEIAVRNSGPDVIKLLLEHGAKPDSSLKSKVVDTWMATPRSLKCHVQNICKSNSNSMLICRNSYNKEIETYRLKSMK